MKYLLYRLIVFLFIVFNFYCASANQVYTSGARQAALSNAGVTLTDVWASYHNQACLAYLDKPVAGLHYENRFTVNELSLRSMVFAMPVRNTTIGLNYSLFGYSKFNESKIGLAAAKKIFSNLAIGIQIDYYLTHIDEESGNISAIMVEIGAVSEPVKNFKIATHIYNPTLSGYNEIKGSRLPALFEFGFSYTVPGQILFCVESEKEIEKKPVIKGGSEYQLCKNFCLRAGLSSSELSRYSFGFGFQFKRFKTDLAFSYHPVLSYTPYVSLSYDFR